MLNYQEFEQKVGVRFDVVEGDLVESPTGPFVVSYNYEINTIYINKLNKTAVVIPDKSSYIGKEYALRFNDCTTLWTQWLDSHKGSNYAEIYKKMGHREYYHWMKSGLCAYFETQPFIKVDVNELEEGDCLVYSYNNSIDSHVGVYIANDKILQHRPKKYSSLDALDKSKILGAYRYGN